MPNASVYVRSSLVIAIAFVKLLEGARSLRHQAKDCPLVVQVVQTRPERDVELRCVAV